MNNATNKLETSAIDELYLDITLEGSKNANRFSVRPTGKEGNGGDKVWLFLHGVLDSCEKLEYTYAASTTNDSRDIKIYLADEYVDPIDEVHWDSTTNPFEYIIKQQFYEVSPNPNGATTLYTDYNITSSKIITADNITTMRSDLNLVTNNVDVISYDVNEMNTVMESLKGRVSRTEQVTQHLEDDVDNLRIVSWTALAFGVAGTAGSIGSIGMQLFPDGISFPTIKGGGFLKRLFSHKSTKGMSDLVRNSINFMSGTTARSITKDITPIITWCEEEYKQLDELPFTDENDNPDTGTLTLSGAMDISNMFRDSLKPCFKLLAEKVNELEAEFDNYPTVDEANEGLDVLIRRIETLEGENIALKDTIAAMEARLTALEEKNDPDREWKAYYTGFTDVTDEYNRYFLFSYFTSEKHIIIDNLDNDPTGDNEPVPDGEYLLIFKDKTQKLHFIRFISTEWSDPQQIKSYLDEIYFKDTNPPSGAYDIYNIELDCDECSMICFDAIYMKK